MTLAGPGRSRSGRDYRTLWSRGRNSQMTSWPECAIAAPNARASAKSKYSAFAMFKNAVCTEPEEGEVVQHFN